MLLVLYEQIIIEMGLIITCNNEKKKKTFLIWWHYKGMAW